MMKTESFVFFIDIDDTLMVHGRVSIKNRQAINQARKAGHKVFINTARSYGIVPDKIKRLRVDGFVTALGCNVKYRKKEIYSAKMPLEESAGILDYFTKTETMFSSPTSKRECPLSEPAGSFSEDIRMKTYRSFSYRVC